MSLAIRGMSLRKLDMSTLVTTWLSNIAFHLLFGCKLWLLSIMNQA